LVVPEAAIGRLHEMLSVAEFCGWIGIDDRVRSGQKPRACPVEAAPPDVSDKDLGRLVRIGIIELAAEQHPPVFRTHLENELRRAGRHATRIGFSWKNLLTIQMIDSPLVPRHHLYRV